MSVEQPTRCQLRTALPPPPSLFDDTFLSPPGNQTARGGLDGGESITATFGGLDGGESVTATFGGLDGGESVTATFGGLDGGESINAKAELATAQPATKATRLTFIMITPSVLITTATMRNTVGRCSAMLQATRKPESPHIAATMYA
ncbi:MAG TPA: hypothetical protein VNW26_09595 [Steroidobacteraceae bacterium]|nr:hypothetical protein [Steroidobacteraceae bacterium]